MLQISTGNTKCDVRDCKNLANFFVSAKGKIGRFYLCKQCCEKLYAQLTAQRTPKSPKNTIKKIIDKKAEEENE